MRRTRTIIRPLILAIAIAAIVAPAAPASGGPFTYPPQPSTAADTSSDHATVTIALVLAGASLLLGAATVLPRRHRVAV